LGSRQGKATDSWGATRSTGPTSRLRGTVRINTGRRFADEQPRSIEAEALVNTSLIRILFLAPLLLASCQPPEPTAFVRGEEIPLGSWSVEVRSAEAMSLKRVPGFGQMLKGKPDSTILAVRVEIQKGGASARDPEKPASVKGKFLELVRSFRLVDGQGHEYPFGMPLPYDQYRMLKWSDSLSAADLQTWNPETRHWALLFPVPSDVSDFSLVVKNRAPREGQPRLASVDLGR
jgi:hypothetical protein